MSPVLLPSRDQQVHPADREDHDRANVAQYGAEDVARIHEAHGPVEVREPCGQEREPETQPDSEDKHGEVVHAPDCNDKLIGAQV